MLELDASPLDYGFDITLNRKMLAMTPGSEFSGAHLGKKPWRIATNRVKLFADEMSSIDHVITMKRASARPHDLVVANELRAISDELGTPPV